MKKTIKLTEKDLTRIVKRLIKENSEEPLEKELEEFYYDNYNEIGLLDDLHEFIYNNIDTYLFHNFDYLIEDFIDRHDHMDENQKKIVYDFFNDRRSDIIDSLISNL